MVEGKAILEAEGYKALELMLKAGRRLPKKEVSAGMYAWGSSEK